MIPAVSWPISAELSQIPAATGGRAVSDAATPIVVRLAKHHETLLNIVKHHETHVKHYTLLNILNHNKTS